MPADWRIVFAGTPVFAVAALDALVAHGPAPVAVYCQPDRPAGRGRQVRPGPVAKRATALGIPVLQPGSFGGDAARRSLAALAPDLMVVAAYGELLPVAVLDTPRMGCINVHASLLPRWRGASPIQHALLAGDAETGVSIMQMDAGLDTGPVWLTRSIPISDADTAATLHDRLAVLGGEALVETLTGIAAGTLEARPQPETGATVAPRLHKQDAWLDFTQPATRLWRQVRAFDAWPVAQARIDGEVMRILRARPVDGTGTPGCILESGRDGIVVACGEGALCLLEVQMPGGRRIAAADLANARELRGGRFES